LEKIEPMGTRYLDPTNDVAFKRLFSDKPRLKDFLNAIFPADWAPIADLDFIPLEEMPAVFLGRRSVFDLRCTDETGKVYIVEMQNRSQDAFLNRIQCYASHAYVAQAVKGGDHRNLMPVIVLSLTSDKLFEDDVPCVSYHWDVEQTTKKRLLMAISYIFVELPKFKKTEAELQDIRDEWLYFFANWEHLKAPPEDLKDPLVLSAYETMEQFNWTPGQYDAYFRMRLAIEADQHEIERSEEKGRAEGRVEEKKEIAHNLLARGMNPEEIARVTNLPVEEIRKFQEV